MFFIRCMTQNKKHVFAKSGDRTHADFSMRT